LTADLFDGFFCDDGKELEYFQTCDEKTDCDEGEDEEDCGDGKFECCD
jgi:hypothetical protein